VSHATGGDSYRADIDGLRALAVLLVLVFHFHLAPWGEAGFLGVDVFFVISGFLITSIVKRQLDDGSFGLGGFYAARVRRLSPALVATLALTLAAGGVLLFADDFLELSRQVAMSQLYVANIYFWRHVNYFGLGQDNIFLLHTWSLAVEEQFYLLYPFALALLHKRLPAHFWKGIVLAMLLSFALNVAFVGVKPEATFYLLPTRSWELLVGALVPAVSARWASSQRTNEVLAAVGFALIFGAVLLYTRDYPFPGFFALLPVLGSALLLFVGSDGRSTLVSRVLHLRPVTDIGKISYPLYLVHWPIYVLGNRVLPEQAGSSGRWAMFAASFALATLLYHAVENPVRRRRWLATTPRLLAGYAGGLCATLLASALVLATSGLPQRFDPQVSRMADRVNDRSPPLTECEYEYHAEAHLQASDFCRIGAVTGAPAWLVVGDSHAWAAHRAFDLWLREKGQGGLFMFRHGCPPVLGVEVFGDRGECKAFNDALAEFLPHSGGVANVLLVGAWREAPEGRLSDSATVSASPARSVALFQAGFTRTVSTLRAAGKAVYVGEPVPGARRNVPVALARALRGGAPSELSFSRAQYFADNDFFFSVLARNRSSIRVSFSPSAALCDPQSCAVTIAGVPAYFDNAHLAQSPAEFWVRMLDEQEAKAAQRPGPGAQ